jgi:RNA polymerase sigma factor (sigma-70 family)
LVAVPSIGRADRVVPARHAREAEATRDLYERYARQIYVYCLHQLGNREEAEDATQSTFLNAFRGLKRGVDPEFESAWLYKIAQNVCLTRQRSSSRRRRVESPGDLDAMQDSLAAHVPDSDELIDLPEALALLPEQQRRALLLREWQGLSYREIAEELELSQAAVETLLFRARRALAAGLTKDDEPSGAKQVVRKLRAGGDAGSVVALVKTLLFSGGAKVVATVATVAATSVVAATPATRHAVVLAFSPAPVAHHRVEAAHAPAAPVAAVRPQPAPVAAVPRHDAAADATAVAPTGAVRAARSTAAPAAHRRASSVAARPHLRVPPERPAPGVTPAAAAPPAATSAAAPASQPQPQQPATPAAENAAPPSPGATDHGHDGGDAAAAPAAAPQSEPTPPTNADAGGNGHGHEHGHGSAAGAGNADAGNADAGNADAASPGGQDAATQPPPSSTAADSSQPAQQGRGRRDDRALSVVPQPLVAAAQDAPVTTPTVAAATPPPAPDVTPPTPATPGNGHGNAATAAPAPGAVNSEGNAGGGDDQGNGHK